MYPQYCLSSIGGTYHISKPGICYISVANRIFLKSVQFFPPMPFLNTSVEGFPWVSRPSTYTDVSSLQKKVSHTLVHAFPHDLLHEPHYTGKVGSHQLVGVVGNGGRFLHELLVHHWGYTIHTSLAQNGKTALKIYLFAPFFVSIIKKCRPSIERYFYVILSRKNENQWVILKPEKKKGNEQYERCQFNEQTIQGIAP